MPFKYPFSFGLEAPAGNDSLAYWFLFVEDKLLIKRDGEQFRPVQLVDPAGAGLAIGQPHYLGQLAGVPCFAADLGADFAPPAGFHLSGLRRLVGLIDEDLFWVSGRAIQIIEWERNHRFCGRCGHPTQFQPGERAKICPNCQLTNYPRLSPAIIVAIVRHDQILLARARHFPAGMHSVLAGFVEPGESLENCVRREIKEEVGLDVTNITYFGSQPWAFPNSLMIAFTCDYAGGEIEIQDSELEAAGWFTATNLPPIPQPPTISRQLIDWFVNR